MSLAYEQGPRIYYPEDDRHLHVRRQIWLGGACLNLDAATNAGRRLAESPQKPNEDAFSIIENYDGSMVAAVFDGASSQKAIAGLGNTSGARYASHMLRDLMDSLPGGLEPDEMLQQIDEWLGEELAGIEGVDRDDPNTLPTSTATILQFDPATGRLNTAHVGDSYALVRRNDGRADLITNNLHRAPDEEILRHLQQLAIENNTTPRAIKTAKDQLHARLGAIIKQETMNMFATTRNRPDGQGEGMANGDPNMYQYIDARHIDLSEIDGALIGSDGSVPPTMHESNDRDRQMIADIVLAQGVAGLIRYTRKIEDSDPEWQHVRHKHADDATAVSVTLR